MITELTQSQKEKFPLYVKKWIDIGLSTETANRKEAENGIIEAYKVANLPAPKIVWCGSPMSQAITNSICIKMKYNVKDSVGDNVWNSVRDSVGDSVWDSVGDSVWDSVGDNVWDNVWNSVRDNVWNSVRNSVWDSVWNSVGDNIGKTSYGQHDAPWLALCEYFKEVCNLKKETKKISGLIKISKNAGWFIPYKNICWVSERHNKLFLKDGKLHNEKEMALQYPDGWGIYALNGIRVPGWVVTTPWNEIDCKLLITEKNVEIRREIVRKVGIEKICKDLKAKKVDTTGDYELLMLDIGDNKKRPYLKMKNPSIGCYHIEGVPPECNTVEKALNSRKPDEMRKIPIDNVNGQDWYQQGDVCVWPRDAKSLKSRPRILT